MPKINRKKMKTALLYLDTRSRGSTSRCCRIAHAKNVALSGAIYTLVRVIIFRIYLLFVTVTDFTVWCILWFIHNLTLVSNGYFCFSEKTIKNFHKRVVSKEPFRESHCKSWSSFSCEIVYRRKKVKYKMGWRNKYAVR